MRMIRRRKSRPASRLSVPSVDLNSGRLMPSSLAECIGSDVRISSVDGVRLTKNKW